MIKLGGKTYYKKFQPKFHKLNLKGYEICHGQSNLSVGDNKCLCPRRGFNCFYCGATICLKQLDINLIMYCNVKITGLP